MYRYMLGVMLLAVALMSGCGRSTKSVRVEVPPAVEQIRMTLQPYADSGQLDSGVVALHDQIEALKADDPAKAATLESDLTELEGLKTPDKVKAKAQEMLGKL
ncbi:MAG: hypothetical protein R3C99_02000 [Pirellulaceae bacterium]|nr:hypothetical protein [Planctomycetales bacterium]MCA9224092.1 hypothetical protein [Planctomycetales bacterium]